jgi:hypothetical protein
MASSVTSDRECSPPMTAPRPGWGAPMFAGCDRNHRLSGMSTDERQGVGPGQWPPPASPPGAVTNREQLRSGEANKTIRDVPRPCCYRSSVAVPPFQPATSYRTR